MDSDFELTGTATVTTNESSSLTTSLKFIDLEATKAVSQNYRLGESYRYMTDDSSSNISSRLFVRRDF
jgi:hypothetical protein